MTTEKKPAEGSLVDLVGRELDRRGVKFVMGEPTTLKIEPLDITMVETRFQSTPADMGDGTHYRSCWECNSAHEHLKSIPRLVCIVCNKMFENGVEK